MRLNGSLTLLTAALGIHHLMLAVDAQVCSDAGQACSSSSDCCSGECKGDQTCAPFSRFCPSPGSSSDVGLPNGGFIEIDLSSAGNLCTLSSILSDPNDPSKDIQVIPISRSYNGKPWERVAGPYSEAVFLSGQHSCVSDKCTIQLPAEEVNSRYVLTSYEHSLSKKDEIARFLDQVTFGVTSSVLGVEEAAYDSALDADHWRAKYVKDQMDPIVTPLTSHREWWRKRTNAKMTHSTSNGRSDNPCDENSRWRRYTFNRHDTRNAITEERKIMHFYTPTEDDGLPDPVIYEAEDLILSAPDGLTPLDDTGNGHTNGFYDLCEGDCDDDSDCAEGLVCYKRDEYEPVPGCYGHGSDGWDYCIDVNALVGDTQVTYTGNPLNPNPGGECEGDCDSDSDCAGDLRCWQRSKNGGPIPGCYGHELVEKPSDDFCFDPKTSWTLPSYFGYEIDSTPHSGFTGTNYLAHTTDSNFGQDKSWAEWTIEVVTDEVYPLSIRYAQSKTKDDLKVEMIVNEGSENEQVETISMPFSLGSDHWRYTKYVDAHLHAGVNKVKIRNMQYYGADIDHLRVGKGKSTIIELDGHYRTVIKDRVRFTEGIDINSKGESILYSNDATKYPYEICKTPHFYNEVYNEGKLEVRPQGASGCTLTAALDTMNPLVDFSGYENYAPGVVFNLPDLSDSSAWAPVDDTEDYYNIIPGYDFILKNGIQSNPLCGEVPISAEESDAPILAKLPDGTWLQWTGQLVLEENTAENPNSDGGGAAASNTDHMECINAPRNFLNEENCALSDSDMACAAENREFTGGATVVCGSIGEVSNERSYGQLFGFAHDEMKTMSDSVSSQQKTKVWTHIALEGQDQLRQRMAWALCQIFTVVEDNISEKNSELYLNYYDICVRNAFGNFRDILKEASYSPLMATHLTFMGSKSAAYIYDNDGKISSPDENYAREVMQLFTVGLDKLNADGTPQRDENGRIIQVYSNEDIMSFSRSWTGFQSYRGRGNYEQGSSRWRNHIDPLYVEESWRDRFPKHDLTGGYVGDTYPLCVDMPEKAFLHKGAKYRLLGSNPLPELMVDHPDLQYGDLYPDIKRMVLDPSSNLYAELYSEGEYQAVVTLTDNLDCVDIECDVDTVRVVQVATNPDIFYEYIALPCVHQAFYEGGKQIAREDRHDKGVMCADQRLPVASEACGNQDIVKSVRSAYRSYKYTSERMTYATAEARCASHSSTLPFTPLDDSKGKGNTDYGHCQGDCDSDDDCIGDLVCFERSGHEDVPGCNMTIEELPVIPLDDSLENNLPAGSYGRCQGDCDRDTDCIGNLVCFKRSGHEDVPGCNMTVEELPVIPLDDSLGNNLPAGSYGHCQGDCDRDTDCIGNLVCFERSGYEDVPGCDMTAGQGKSGRDYCVSPEQLGVSGRDYCVSPERLGIESWDYCVDPSFDGGIFKFGTVSGAHYELGYHWTSFDCSIYAKINNEGYVAIAHETDNLGSIPPHLDAEQSLNYFKVYWNGDGTYPSPDTGCGHCQLSTKADACICPTKVMDEIVFTDQPASAEEIVSSLHIGAIAPDVAGPPGTFSSQECDDFTVHFPQSSAGVYTGDTIFELDHPYHGTKLFLKNTKSTVHLEGWEQETTILEAEDAVAGGLSAPNLVLASETGRSRFSGSGYMDYEGNAGGYLEWTVNAPENIDVTISFRYENSWGPTRVVDILVNNNVFSPDGVKLGSTGHWDYWMDSESFSVPLNHGDNVIQLKHSDAWSGPKIDYLKIEWPTTPSSYSFRNAPHFMSLSQDYGDDGEGETTARDAYYETDAVLDHYHRHPNTAPFICTRLIQRFGISNPSPGHIKTCADAFRTGAYVSGGHTFGSGDYGSLEAVTAAITLGPEATSNVLDADPGHGRIREPFLQPIQVLRSLEAKLVHLEHHFELWELFDRLSQEPHRFQSVFSHFLPEYISDIGPTIVPEYVSPESMTINMPSIISQLNGLMGLARYGISDCLVDNGMALGFGTNPGRGSCLDDGSMQRASAVLSFIPEATTTVELIQELNTLLCAGRLSQARQDKIVDAYDSYSPAYDEAGAKLRFAYQLIMSTPEFHTNTMVKEDSANSRSGPLMSTSGAVTNDYKAVIFLFLSGGVDSFSMLPPYTCQDDLYEKYVDIRGGLSDEADPGIAIPKQNLFEIPTNNQDHVCSSVGLHQSLKFIEELYERDDALFVTNTGLMQFPVTKENYRDTDAQIFAHNAMQLETMREDIEDEKSGTGVLGRMKDILTKAGFSCNAYSLDSSRISVVGSPGVSDNPITLPSRGMQNFIPHESSDLTPDMKPYILSLNNATAIDSPFMGETWSTKVNNAIREHEMVYSGLEEATVTANFADSSGSKSSLCKQLEMTAKVMSLHESFGSERDFFHVEKGGWDLHSNTIESLGNKFDDVNHCLKAFVEEVEHLGLWENTVLVQFSEFGRTLSPNSGPNGDGTEKGCDHAWGGNQFVIGGGLKGGQVLGQYPLDFTESGPLALSRGRMIPTTPWDAIWSGVAPWMGVSIEDMDYVLPMKKNFDSSSLFTKEMIFNP